MRITILFCCLLTFFSCKKENGKNLYQLTYQFNSGDIFTETGVIYEKYKKNKKYLAPIDSWGQSIIKEETGLFLKFRSKMIALTTEDKKILINEEWNCASQNPVVFANNLIGGFYGEIYMEGSYIQKGRAYSVENGTFEFYWRNAEDFGMTDTILKGTWTLKRK